MITLKTKQGQTNMEYSALVKMIQSKEFETLKNDYLNLPTKEAKSKYSEDFIPKYSPSLYHDEDGIKYFNNLIAFKIERLNEDAFIEFSKNQLVYSLYQSFTAKSTVLIVRVNQLLESDFENAKTKIVKHFQEECKVELKPLPDFVNVTHDPKVYFNLNSKVFEARPPKEDVQNGVSDESLLQKLKGERNTIGTISKRDIKFGEPILTRNSEGVVFPNSITVIQGKSGVHKSRLVQHICSTFIQDKSKQGDSILGFNTTTQPLVVYIDTERSITEQFPAAIQDIKLNGGYRIQDDVRSLDFYSMISTPRNNRRKAIKLLIKEIKSTTNREIVIVLDVATDLINDFNSVDETMRLIDFINECINSYNISFIVLIHENPGFQTDKARGHLGTEFMNKATTQISIKGDAEIKDTKYYKVSYLKCRNSKLYMPYYVRFDEFNKVLVEVTEKELLELRNARNRKADIEEIAEYIGTVWEENISQKTLIEYINKEFELKDRAARDRLKAIEENQISINGNDGFGYRLLKNADKPVTYRLGKIEYTSVNI